MESGLIKRGAAKNIIQEEFVDINSLIIQEEVEEVNPIIQENFENENPLIDGSEKLGKDNDELMSEIESILRNRKK